MVYKKYIKRNGKTYGPYYCESYRYKGKIKTRFVSGPKKRHKIVRKVKKNIKKKISNVNKTLNNKKTFLIFGIIFTIFFLLLIGNLNYPKISGMVVYDEEIVSSSEMKIAEQIAKGLVSNVDIREHVDLEITQPIFEKNKVLQFDVSKGKIELGFDLLNYSSFVGKDVEQEVEAENFNINMQETAEKYKWGYDVKLKDLNFMAKIDVKTGEEIIIIDDQTLKIGKNYLSFSDLTNQGYVLSINQPVVLEQIEIIEETNITIPDAETNITVLENVTETNVTEETNVTIPDVEINITKEDATIPDAETNITIPEEDVVDIVENITEDLEINETQEEVESEINETQQETAEEEPSEEEIIQETEPEEPVEQLEEIEEPSEEEIIQETEPEEPVEQLEEMGKIEEEPEEIEEANEKPEKEKKEEEPEKEAEESEEVVEIVGITGNVLRTITGFFVRGTKGITGFATQEQENIVSIYIERDFTNSSYQVGDLINLDPFLVIIEITKAQHLDENYTFVSDIYEQVKVQDNVWSEKILDGHYVRVTFEQNLTKERDITIYARSSGNENSEIEVYRQNDNQLITKFTDITDENWYKVYLTNLSENETYDVFDLKVLGEIEFDYIVDPIPDVSITSPLNNTNTSDVGLNINYTSAGGIDSCWYSSDYYVANITLASCINITNVAWAEGQHNVTIWVNDSLNKINSSLIFFTIDIIEPNLTISFPLNNTITSDIGLNINYTSSDAITMVDTCWYSNDSMSANTTLLSCANITTVTWVEGQHNVTVWANDSANNINSSSVKFTIDTIVPDINITYPLNHTNTTDIEIDVNYTRGSDADACWYSNDSMSDNTTLVSCVNVTSVNWTEGQHNVTVWANDSANNINSSFVRFTIDLSPPDINISYPLNHTNTTDIEIDVNYTRGSDADACWYSNDSMSDNTTLVSCVNVTSVNWTEGQHNVTIWVNDSLDNINSSFVRFTIDTVEPDINITYPTNNSNSSNTRLNINYTRGSDVNTCWYSNDSMSANTTLLSCANITTVTWVEGQHNVTVWANDSANNINSSSVRFTINTTLPDINITYPPNNTNTTDTGLNVNYTRGSDVNTCWYSNDSMSANTTLVSCANITTVNWTEGQHDITIWVNDSLNNINSSSVRFLVDTQGPVVTLISPSGTVTSTSVTFTYNATDALAISNCTLILDGTLVSTDSSVANGTTESISYTATSGTHTYLINCTDELNQVGASALNAFEVVIPTSVVTGGGGGGGGIRIISLDIVALTPEFLYETGQIKVPLIINNDGETAFSSVALTGFVLEEEVIIDVNVNFSEAYFSSIGVGENKETTLIADLTVDDLDKQIIVNATSMSPKYETSEIIVLDFFGENITEIRKLMSFVENMIVENPKCFGLEKIVDEARESFVRGDFNKAILKSNEALESCRAFISGPKKAEYLTLKARITEDIVFYLVVVIIISIVFAIVFNLYKMFRFRKR